MASLENLQQKEIELDLSGIPDELKEDAKQAIGEYIKDQTIEFLADGRSPVAREKFKELNEDYAKKFKGGDPTPNLYLDGDLQGSLDFEITEDGLIWGVMDENQRPKADGHNNFSGDSKLPKRRFIPGDGQKFNSEIESGIKNILNDFKIETQIDQTETRGTSLRDLLSNEGIAELLLRRLNR